MKKPDALKGLKPLSECPAIYVQVGKGSPYRLALIERNKLCLIGTGVIGFWTDQAIIANLFEDVGSPASAAANGEGRREEVSA